ncbi:MAG: hypothetical protein FWB95_02605 [Treponema sp.]|nr:hypothetical protein [Treponema sp.]
MELSDEELEEIRIAARGVEFGSVTINISATSDSFELNVQHRIRRVRIPEVKRIPKKVKVRKKA